MRTAFIETLCQVAEANPRVWLLTGDLGYSVLEPFSSRFPDRFANLGVAEQNMIGVAAGLALEKNIVFVYSIANFPIIRCLEQVRNDVCYHNLDVKIVTVGGGLAYGSAGYTHHGLEDLAAAQALPNMTVLAPGDPLETRLATAAAADRPGPCFLRLGKGGEAAVHPAPPVFEVGSAIWLRPAQAVTLISTGAILGETVKAADLLAQQGIPAGVVSLPTLKPADPDLPRRLASCRLVVFVEEHSPFGGLSSVIAGLAAALAPAVPDILHIHTGERTGAAVGSQAYLRAALGVDAAHIAAQVMSRLAGRPLQDDFGSKQGS